ncbi:MAG: tolB [Actinomycetia bacterium]|nr:tolB [Actinomycetes bacterium]
MAELKERLDRELSAITPSAGARTAVDRRLDRRRRRRRIALPFATVLITAAIVGGLAYAFRPVPPPGPADVASIPLPGEPFQAIVYGDALWALTTDPGCDGPACRGFVVKVDTVRGEVTAEVPVTSPTGLTAGAGSIWLASFTDATLLRLDPETADVVATIPLVLPGEEPGSDWKFLPTHVDANEGGVWVSTARGAVAHIDPASNTVVDVVPLPPESLGGVAIGREGIWLDNGLGGVIKVDPETHQAEQEGSIDDEAGRRLSMGTPIARGGSLWLVGNWARPVEEFGEEFYEATDRQALVRIEESTGEVSMILDLPKQRCCARLLDDGDVWLVEGDGASLRRLDPVSGQLGPRVGVPFGRPLAVSRTSVWVAEGMNLRAFELPQGGSIPTPSPSISAVSGNGSIYFRSQIRAGVPTDWEAVSSDGTGRHTVFPASGPFVPDHVAFSPDSERLAVSLVGRLGIWLADPDGSDLTQLTDGANDAWPVWSPDGKKIAFAGSSASEPCPDDVFYYGCPRDLYVVNADATGLRMVASGARSPSWSPDGERIVFQTSGATGGTAIAIVNADGTGRTVLASTGQGSNLAPAWSPDGSTIVYSSIRREDWGIFAIPASGGPERELVPTGSSFGYVDDPTWSPDGSRIAFVADSGIAVMRPDGSGITQLVVQQGRYPAGAIAWQPVP